MRTFPLDNLTLEDIQAISGVHDANIAYAEKTFRTSVSLRNGELIVEDDEKAEAVYRFFQKILKIYHRKGELDLHDLNYAADHLADEENLAEKPVGKTFSGRLIYPKTGGQKKLFLAMQKYDIVFAVGPAGTGKTYLAMAMAVTAFKNEEVGRIIMTRPAIEAGEKLGFLPGDLQSKVDPYLRPLYDALFDMLGVETYQKYLERGNIEVAPLAYMRGRTLDDSFIILDEAQNTSGEQMKMFLTRLGVGSKMVITGDVSQIDLGEEKTSGLKVAMKVLEGIDDVAICTLTGADVVRHRLVQKIIESYEAYEKKSPLKESSGRPDANRKYRRRTDR